MSTRAAADPEVLAMLQLLFFSHESIGINGHFIRVIKCGCIPHLYPVLPPSPSCFHRLIGPTAKATWVFFPTDECQEQFFPAG